MTTVKWVNHSSLLIENQDNIILTDPWFEKPAFGSWLPVPPPIYHPVYLASLAESNKHKFTLLISHGHDDHCDDDFLKLFPNDIKVVIPKFSSPGFKKRVERAGFNNIIEIDKTAAIDGVTYNCYIHHDVSHEDAIITIKTSDSYIVHSNDNWRFEEDVVTDIIKNKDGLTSVMATQIGIANGWPYLYNDYSVDEREKIAQEKLRLITEYLYVKMVDMGIDHFFVYAGHSKAYTKDPDIMGLGGSQPHSFYKDAVEWKDIDFLEMLPGDTFDTGSRSIVRQFSNVATQDSLKLSSEKFYDIYKKYEMTDSYVNNQILLTKEERSAKIASFLEGFNDYVVSSIKRLGNYQEEIIGSKIRIQDDDGEGVSIEINRGIISGGTMDTTHTLTKPLLDAILVGKIIWENAEIGLQMSISKPKEYHNGHIMRWLAKYGYIWFKNERGKAL